MKRFAAFTVIVFTVQFIVGCSTGLTAIPQTPLVTPSFQFEATKIISITETISLQPSEGSANYRYVTTLKELISQSTAIVVGQVTGSAEIINMSRDVNDLSKPDPRNFIAGQVYHVKIERYLKGSDSTVLDVVQPEAFIVGHLPTSEAEVEKAKANYKYIQFQLAMKYLMFLRPLKGFAGESYYVGAVHPWRFSLTQTGTAQPESPWADALRYFPPRPTTALLGDVEKLVNGQINLPTPTPPLKHYP